LLLSLSVYSIWKNVWTMQRSSLVAKKGKITRKNICVNEVRKFGRIDSIYKRFLIYFFSFLELEKQHAQQRSWSTFSGWMEKNWKSFRKKLKIWKVFFEDNFVKQVQNEKKNSCFGVYFVKLKCSKKSLKITYNLFCLFFPNSSGWKNLPNVLDLIRMLWSKTSIYDDSLKLPWPPPPAPHSPLYLSSLLI